MVQNEGKPDSHMIHTTVHNVPLELETEVNLFSPAHPDTGTMALLQVAPVAPTDKVLDLGCGYGLVGIYAAKVAPPANVVLCDNDPSAVAMARRDAAANGVPEVRAVVSDGLSAITDHDFTLVLCNPPYHVDFDVPKRFIEDAFTHMAVGGRMAMVIKRRAWYENKLRAVFGGVWVTEIDGYLVMVAEKRQAAKPVRQPKGTTKKHQKRMAASGKQ